jgi:hypothetical protein
MLKWRDYMDDMEGMIISHMQFFKTQHCSMRFGEFVVVLKNTGLKTEA